MTHPSKTVVYEAEAKNIAQNQVIWDRRAFTACLRIIITSIVEASDNARPTRKTMLNAVGLGYSPTLPSTSMLTSIDDMITVAISGPIAPPMILISLVEADEIPVSSFGVKEIMMFIRVIGKSAAPIPNRNSEPAIPDAVD